MEQKNAKQEFLLRVCEAVDYLIMEHAQNYKGRRGCYVGESWVELRGAKENYSNEAANGRGSRGLV